MRCSGVGTVVLSALLEQLALPIELARLRLDLLHSPDFIPPWRGRFRRLITVHDLTFLYTPQFLTAESRRYYNDQIERAVRESIPKPKMMPPTKPGMK